MGGHTTNSCGFFRDVETIQTHGRMKKAEKSNSTVYFIASVAP
jgi:hypothetical protein